MNYYCKPIAGLSLPSRLDKPTIPALPRIADPLVSAGGGPGGGGPGGWFGHWASQCSYNDKLNCLINILFPRLSTYKDYLSQMSLTA